MVPTKTCAPELKRTIGKQGVHTYMAVAKKAIVSDWTMVEGKKKQQSARRQEKHTLEKSSKIN